MPDNNNTAGQGANSGSGENNGAPVADNTETKTGNETAGQGGGDGGGASGEGNGTGQGQAKAPQGSQSQEGDDEPPVKPRKSAKDFIIERQQRKINKLQQKAEEGGQGDGEDDDDDELLPEDEEMVVKTFQKRVLPGLQPFIDKNIAAEDDTEIGNFLKDNHDFAPYEAKVRKWVAHPSRRHLPIESIFYEVAGKDLLKLGAERGRKADEEARNTQTGGGSGRDTAVGEKKISDMTDDEIREKQARLRGQGA